MSAQGICSRREAERWIEQGRVTINGRKADLGSKMDPRTDVLHVDGQRVFLQKNVSKVYYAMYKPRGVVSTLKDSHADKTVADMVAHLEDRLYPIGRLDKESEGLLIMTNDGEFTQLLTHPSKEVSKTYRVSVQPAPDEEQLIALASGVELEDGFVTKEARVRVVKVLEDRATIEMVLTEGHNREIRKMCDAVGLKVLRLKRIAIGPLKMVGMKAGDVRKLTSAEIAALRRSASGK